MAGLLYVYTSSSIRAAKRNAQLHREADGGQINWQKENLRRHGVIDAPGEGRGTVTQLTGELKEQMKGEDMLKARARKKD